MELWKRNAFLIQWLALFVELCKITSLCASSPDSFELPIFPSKIVDNFFSSETVFRWNENITKALRKSHRTKDRKMLINGHPFVGPHEKSMRRYFKIFVTWTFLPIILSFTSILDNPWLINSINRKLHIWKMLSKGLEEYFFRKWYLRSFWCDLVIFNCNNVHFRLIFWLLYHFWSDSFAKMS